MPQLHASIRAALANEQRAVDALAALLPESKRDAPALPLPPTETSTGLLVGRLLPLTDGTTVISNGRKSHCQVVFAPALSVRFRAALVYIPDFRSVRLRGGGSGGRASVVLEVLSERVQVLLACDYYAEPAGVAAGPLMAAGTLLKKAGKRRNVHAKILAKSPIMGSGKSARFFLEIGSLDDTDAAKGVAVFVVFVGKDALKWWPFLSCEEAYTFVGLKHAKLPRYGNRNVFKVSDESARVHEFAGEEAGRAPDANDIPATVRTVSFGSARGGSLSPPPKRPRSSSDAASLSERAPPSQAPADNAPFRWSDNTVTYQGVISSILPDGRLLLDDRVYLHLGGDTAWCAGNSKTFVCFRVGARIEALNVLIAFQRGHPTTIFPTARTVVSIVYFGSVLDNGVVDVTQWQDSPWFRYWSHLSPPYILWAQELFDTLPDKFRLWLTATQPEEAVGLAVTQSSRDMARYMLGADGETGLIEYLMELVTGSNSLFQRTGAPTFFYSDFLEGNGSLPLKCEERLPDFPYAATLAEISAAVDVKWLASDKTRAGSASAAARTGSARVAVKVFTNKVLSQVLCSASRRVRNQCGTRIVLIGMLEGCTDSSGTAQITDATGSMHVEFTGHLDPSLLGAIVVVQVFHVAVEVFPGNSRRKATLLLSPTDVQVLIDGLYVDVAPAEHLKEQDSAPNGRASQGFRNGDSSVRLCLSQNKPAEGASSLLSESQTEEDFDDFPLAAVCVDSVSAIVEHSDGQSRFRIKGFLVAFCANRSAQNWADLRINGEYSRCCFVVHGNSATKIRAALAEGKCYGIGCSDFANCEDIPKLCKQRAEYGARIGRPLLLFSAASGGGLWIQWMDGMEGVSTIDGANGATDVTDSVVAIRKVVHAFADECNHQTDSSLMKMLSPVWKPTILSSDHSPFRIPLNDLVSLSGTFLFFEMCPPANPAPIEARTPNYRLALRDTESSLLTALVLFSASTVKPRGLVPGTTVRLLNVRRVGMGNGDVMFSAGAFTRVVRTATSDSGNSVPSLCCSRPLPGNDVLLPLFPHCFLWTFSLSARMGRTDSVAHTLGLVRVNVLEIKSLQFFVNRACSGCPNCQCVSGSDWCAGATATAAIEDGTTHGELICPTFQTVMELLGATDEDSLTFRQSLPGWQPSQDVLSAWKDSRKSPVPATTAADVALERFVVSCRRALHVIGKNASGGRGSVPSSESQMIDEAEVRGHNLGFGKKLWTAESAKMHQVRVVALGIFEEEGLVDDGQVRSSKVISVQERYRSQFL